MANGSADFIKAIENLRADEQLYVEELENLGKAFEQMQNENSNLVKKLADKDEQISKLTSDKLKAEFAMSHNSKESESSLERAQKIEEIAKHRIHEIESREESLRRQVVLNFLLKYFLINILGVHGKKSVGPNCISQQL